MVEFLDMGGYGQFVWPAYGLSAIGLAGLTAVIWRRGRRLRRKLKDLESRADDARRT